MCKYIPCYLHIYLPYGRSQQQYPYRVQLLVLLLLPLRTPLLSMLHRLSLLQSLPLRVHPPPLNYASPHLSMVMTHLTSSLFSFLAYPRCACAARVCVSVDASPRIIIYARPLDHRGYTLYGGRLVSHRRSFNNIWVHT